MIASTHIADEHVASTFDCCLFSGFNPLRLGFGDECFGVKVAYGFRLAASLISPFCVS